MKRLATLAIETPWRPATDAVAVNTRCSALHPPAIRRKRPYFIRDQVERRSQSGSGAPSQAFGEPATGQRAVRQQLHAVLDAERRQPARRTLIEQRERHLVRHDVDAARDDHPQVGRVNVGQAKVTDEASGLQILKVEQCFQPALIGVVPGVVLQQIDRLHTEGA